MRVRVPTHLHDYTRGVAEVEVACATERATLGDVLAELERAYPGLRFRVVDEQDRIRRHIQFFVGSKAARDLAHPVDADDEVRIVAALSGG
ncbi:MAG: MoaD/ThiS family protein [Planctomycetota bacterium]